MENGLLTMDNYGYFSAEAEKFRIDLFLKLRSNFKRKKLAIVLLVENLFKEIIFIKNNFLLNCQLSIVNSQLKKGPFLEAFFIINSLYYILF